MPACGMTKLDKDTSTPELACARGHAAGGPCAMAFSAPLPSGSRDECSLANWPSGSAHHNTFCPGCWLCVLYCEHICILCSTATRACPGDAASTNWNILRAFISTFSLQTAVQPSEVVAMPLDRCKGDRGSTNCPTAASPGSRESALFPASYFTLGAASTSNGVRAALGKLGLDPFLAPPPAVGEQGRES